jgi:hypothetical protein
MITVVFRTDQEVGSPSDRSAGIWVRSKALFIVGGRRLESFSSKRTLIVILLILMYIN